MKKPKASVAKPKRKPAAKIRLPPKRKAQAPPSPSPEPEPARKVRRVRRALFDDKAESENENRVSEHEDVTTKNSRVTEQEADQGDVSTQDENETEVMLKGLTMNSWNMSHVSLVSLQHRNLNNVCREFEAGLQTDAPSLLKDWNNERFRVAILPIPGIEKSLFDSESLKLDIFRETPRDSNHNYAEKEGKLLFSAIFTSCGSTGHGLAFDPADPDSPNNLPIFLWYGKSRVWDLIRPILEEKLQCNFYLIHFIPVHMQIFAGLWLYQDVKNSVRSNCGVSIQYQLPTTDEENQADKNVELRFDKWRRNLESVKPGDNLQLKQELMKMWQEALDSYSSSKKVDLSRATNFLKVRTGSCVISSTGRFKLKPGTKVEEFQAFFAQLTRIVELR